MTIFLSSLLAFCIVFFCVLLFSGSFWWALVFFGFTLYLLWGFRKIPSDPPSVGLVTFWGERTGETKEEGITLLAPYFPFFYNVQLIKVVKVNEDISFTNVRCVISENTVQNVPNRNQEIHSGGSVTVVVSVTWIPDKEKLISYTNSGGEKGVKAILSGKMADVIRQIGRTHTWEEMTFATDVMSANLIIEITNLDVKDVERDHKIGKKIKYNITDDQLEKALRFLKTALTNGVADSHDLGIKIQRLNIKQVEPEGELKKDAEDTAREVQQRRAENFELETEMGQAKVLYDKYQENNTTKNKTFEDCVLEIRRRKLIKAGKGQIYDISGIPSDLFSIFKKGGK